jgi:hypothetical protein
MVNRLVTRTGLAYPHASSAHTLLTWPPMGAVAGAELGLLTAIAKLIVVPQGAR